MESINSPKGPCDECQNSGCENCEGVCIECTGCGFTACATDWFTPWEDADFCDYCADELRDLARRAGLMKLLLGIHWSFDLGMNAENYKRLGAALDILGATEDEVQM